MTATFHIGDVFDVLATIPDGSVDAIVTSPPFLALRSYLPADHPDKGKEIGSEPTPAAFLDTLLDLTAEWRRVLAPHGSIAVELGDTYAGSGGGGGDYLEGGMREGQQQFAGSAASMRESNAAHWRQKNQQKSCWPLDKSLCGIPALYANSLAYGRNLLNPDHTCDPWRVRNLIAWCRPNPPVGALGDKCRPATSYVTVACPGRSRWFDMDAERTEHKTKDGSPAIVSAGGARALNKDAPGRHTDDRGPIQSNPAGAPLLDWWEIPTAPYKGSHYATFPPELPRRLINLMVPHRVCNECGKPSERIVDLAPGVGGLHQANGGGSSTTGGHPNGHASQMGVRQATTLGWSDCGHNNWRTGIVLDPFAGSGTTLAVAIGLGRHAIGIDLDERNADLAYERVGMFLEVIDHKGKAA